MQRAITLLVAELLIACSSGPTAFDQRLRDAESARREGGADEAREVFRDAERIANNDEERAEALYRNARAHIRGRDFERGLKLLTRVCEVYPNTGRAARAWLDRGRILQETGNSRAAEQAFLTVIERYPESGIATSSAREYVEARAGGGETRCASYTHLRRVNQSPLLDEALRYFQALCLQETDPKGAASLYEGIADLYPLPKGRYADEALLRAAIIQRRLGNAQLALSHLGQLIKQDKSAAIVGSYTRPSYLSAYLLSARIIRDDFRRYDESAALLERMIRKHQESRSIDEALFELSLVEKRRGSDGCEPMERLQEIRPDSKYLRCKPILCGRDSTFTHTEESENCERWINEGTHLSALLRPVK